MPERERQPGAWLALCLDEETRERWFAPAYYELLEDHLQRRNRLPAPLRLVAAVRLRLQVLLLVSECLRLRATAPRPRPARKGDKTMTLIWQDVRYAARGLAKSPAFTLVAVLTLALGIGANTAIFSVVDAVLLRPLEFREPDRLVALWETQKTQGNQPGRVAPANYKDWSEQADRFEDLAAFSGYAATLTGQGEPVQLKGGAVTANYFAVLGVQPLVGRAFQPADESASEPLVMIGYGLWQSRFGGAQDVVGRSLTLDGTPRTIIGVMPPNLYPAWPVNGPRMHFRPDLQDVWVLIPASRFTNRRSHVMGVIARMKPGVTLEQAQTQMDTVAARLEQAYPQNRDEGAAVRPLLDEAVSAVRPALLILLTAVGAVLLIACSNVASLLLARLTGRRQEIAVRCALGAGRAALVRQFLAEGALLALLGGAAGIALAAWGQGLLFSFIPQNIPRLEQAGLDMRVMAFTGGLSLLAAVVFALAPAWSAGRVNIADAMKEISRGSESARPQSLRRVLVVAQVSLAVVLTLAAGLLTQSFWRMGQVDSGFRPDNLLVADFSLPASGYSQWQQVSNFYQRLEDAVRQVPGVTSAQIAYDHPLETNWLNGFAIEGQPSEQPPVAQLRIVGPGFFSGIGLPLRQGREFDDRDNLERPGVAIVNEAFARQFFPGEQATGKVLLMNLVAQIWGEGLPSRFEIVGVCGDIHPPGLQSKAEPFFYLSARQFPLQEMTLLVRTVGDPLAQVSALRAQVAKLDPALPIAEITTMERVVAQAVAQPRLNMLLMSLFGAMAMCLALVGVYGLVAFWVAARTREIGVRLALGARPADVLRLVLSKGFVLVVIGVALGVAGAVGVARFLQSQLFGISALDLPTLLAIPSAIVAIALLACLIPAWRATRVDPMVALRSE
jgi:putative ABC transport system permease protein